MTVVILFVVFVVNMQLFVWLVAGFLEVSAACNRLCEKFVLNFVCIVS